MLGAALVKQERVHRHSFVHSKRAAWEGRNGGQRGARSEANRRQPDIKEGAENTRRPPEGHRAELQQRKGAGGRVPAAFAAAQASSPGGVACPAQPRCKRRRQAQHWRAKPQAAWPGPQQGWPGPDSLSSHVSRGWERGLSRFTSCGQRGRRPPAAEAAGWAVGGCRCSRSACQRPRAARQGVGWRGVVK